MIETIDVSEEIVKSEWHPASLPFEDLETINLSD